MKIVSPEPEITFDDVLLLPNKSEFPIEEEGHISLKTKVSKNISLDIPILSAPMPSITEDGMAIALGKAGGIGVIHFFQSFERQLDQIAEVKRAKVKVSAGVSELTRQGIRHVGNLLKAGTDLISVESYHGQNRQLIEFIKELKNTYRGVEILAGYVVTAEAAKSLVKAGADAIRVGIGGGSHCTTRLITGIGRPQLSAVADCYKVTKKHNIPLISDTGIKHAGDIPKALVFGADCVMIGGLLAGTSESPSKVFTKNGRKYKYSWGMCTDTALKRKQLPTAFSLTDVKLLIKTGLKRFLKYGEAKKEEKLFEEGVGGPVEFKGSTAPVLKELVAGTRRSMWYQGVRNITQLRKNARVVLVSSSTKQENVPRI